MELTSAANFQVATKLLARARSSFSDAGVLPTTNWRGKVTDWGPFSEDRIQMVNSGLVDAQMAVTMLKKELGKFGAETFSGLRTAADSVLDGLAKGQIETFHLKTAIMYTDQLSSRIQSIQRHTERTELIEKALTIADDVIAELSAKMPREIEATHDTTDKAMDIAEDVVRTSLER